VETAAAAFEELAKYKLYGSIVTNAQAIDPIIDDLVSTGSLLVLFLSLDGWDSGSQNVMRSAASGKMSDNFEKTMAVIDKVHEIKQRKKAKVPPDHAHYGHFQRKLRAPGRHSAPGA